MQAILDFIDHQMLTGHVVYVHCQGGIGRTGTVVGCYLVRHGMTGEEALQAIRELRSATTFPNTRSPETEAQCAMVRHWQA